MLVERASPLFHNDSAVNGVWLREAVQFRVSTVCPRVLDDLKPCEGGHVLNLCRVGATVLTLSSTAFGVASAQPLALPDVTRTVDTVGCPPLTNPPRNCLHLTANLSAMTINSVPNMAATAFTREAYITGIATAVISGEGPWAKSMKGALVRLGVQVGCQVRLDSAQQLNLGGGSINLGVIDVLDLGSIGIPSPTFNIKAGDVVNTQLAEKKVGAADDPDASMMTDASGRVVIRVATHDARVGADQCAGPVTVRMVAAAQVDTPDSTETIVAFGDIVQI